MSVVALNGRLICATEDEAAVVLNHLPRQLALTRAEPGCLQFDVERSCDSLVWTVFGNIVDRAAFDEHQTRVGSSVWGHATAGIAGDYVIDDKSDSQSAPKAARILGQINHHTPETVNALQESLADQAYCAAVALDKMGRLDVINEMVTGLPEELVVAAYAGRYRNLDDQPNRQPLDYSPLEDFLRQYPQFERPLADRTCGHPGDITDTEVAAAEAGLTSDDMCIRDHAAALLESHGQG